MARAERCRRVGRNNHYDLDWPGYHGADAMALGLPSKPENSKNSSTQYLACNHAIMMPVIMWYTKSFTQAASQLEKRQVSVPLAVTFRIQV